MDARIVSLSFLSLSLKYKNSSEYYLYLNTVNVSPTLNEDDSIGSDQNATQDHDSSNLHNRSSSLLNIQGNTFQASKKNNLSVPPVSPENGTNTRTDDNTFPVITYRPIESRSVFGLSLMLANTMSLGPKIDEVRSTILDFKPNLGFITETWLRDTISGNHLHIPGYSQLVNKPTRGCLLYTSPSPRDGLLSRMPSSA